MLIILLICIPLLFAFPKLLCIAIPIGILYLCITKPDLFSLPRQEESAKDETEDASDGIIYGDNFVTYEDKIRAEMEKNKFKPGYRNNKKWKEQSKILKEQVDKAREREHNAINNIKQNL